MFIPDGAISFTTQYEFNERGEPIVRVLSFTTTSDGRYRVLTYDNICPHNREIRHRELTVASIVEVRELFEQLVSDIAGKEAH